jgi:hypothetical protein
LSTETLLKDYKGAPVRYGDNLYIDLGDHPSLGGEFKGTLTKIKNGRLILDDKTSIPISRIVHLEVLSGKDINGES